MTLHYILQKKGLMVFAGVRKESDGNLLINELTKEAKGVIIPVILDVTKEDQVTAAVDFVKSKLKTNSKRLFAVVNNAGILSMFPTETVPLHQIKQLFDVNFFGVITITKAFIPELRLSQNKPFGSRLIFISSLVGTKYLPYEAAYCASKSGIESLSDCIRIELEKWNIKVSTIEPGCFITSLTKDLPSLIIDEQTNHLYPELSSILKLATWLSKYFPGVTSVTSKLDKVLFARYPPSRAAVGIDTNIVFFDKLFYT